MPNILTTFPQRRLLTAAVCMLALSSCSQPSKLPESTGMGTNTDTSISQAEWFPTTQAAETMRWPEGKKSISTPGTNVVAFANDLHHPRWLYALPNGDILVAESYSQPKNEAFSLKSWIISKWMHEADALAGSQHQITLLRDNDGDGIADERHVFIKDIAAPLGVALIGDTFYVANAEALLLFPYQAGQTQMTQTPGAASGNGPDTADQTILMQPAAQEKLAKQPIDVLTEIQQEDGATQTRPANVLLDKRGYLLVADDVGNVIWHVKGNRKVAQK
jgi:glucose/arabinose dehydrogenase